MPDIPARIYAQAAASIAKWGPGCPPCKFPEACACSAGRALQQELEARLVTKQFAPWKGPELHDARLLIDEGTAFPMLREAECFRCRKPVMMKAIRAMKYPWVEYECQNGHRRDSTMTRRDHATIAVALQAQASMLEESAPSDSVN